MLSLRARLFFIISLIVMAILGISLFLIFKPKADLTPVVDNSAENTDASLPVNNNLNSGVVVDNPLAGGELAKNITVKPTTKEENQENSVRQLAKVFFERYNTYSSDNNYQNILDVKALVTPEYWLTLENKVIQKPAINQPFVGVTTKVLMVELKEIKDASAQVYLKSNVNEERNGVITNRYQELIVSLVKVNGVWLVNAIGLNK
ncbi:MAG: hypothetical protein Q7S24_00995 [bacterium]|nr:hypothetical protein [bacterium]